MSGIMTSRKNCLRLTGAVAAFLLVLTPNAFAKHPGTGGQAQVPCGDGEITYSPVALWPPNHKMMQIGISFAESETTTDSDTLGIQVTAISSNQDSQDASGGFGCGRETGPGDDRVFSTTPVTGAAGVDNVPVTTSVQVAAERCGEIKSARVYSIDVTCTDSDGTTDTAVLTVTVMHDKGKH
jgi:hypothetical protein